MTLRYFLELFIQLTTQLLLENMASMQDIAQKKHLQPFYYQTPCNLPCQTGKLEEVLTHSLHENICGCAAVRRRRGEKKKELPL